MTSLKSTGKHPIRQVVESGEVVRPVWCAAFWYGIPSAEPPTGKYDDDPPSSHQVPQDHRPNQSGRRAADAQVGAYIPDSSACCVR